MHDSSRTKSKLVTNNDFRATFWAWLVPDSCDANEVTLQKSGTRIHWFFTIHWFTFTAWVKNLLNLIMRYVEKNKRQQKQAVSGCKLVLCCFLVHVTVTSWTHFKQSSWTTLKRMLRISWSLNFAVSFLKSVRCQPWNKISTALRGSNTRCDIPEHLRILVINHL